MPASATLSKYVKRQAIVCQLTGWAPVTWALIALNLISWFAVAWLYGLPSFKAHNSYVLLRAGAVNGDLLFAGEWWRVITSQSLHVYFPHLVFNMAALLLLGAALERAFGSLRFALLYVISGSVGQVVSIVATPLLISSGASQAVMGVAGATVMAFLRGHVAGGILFIVLLGITGIQVGLDIMVAHTVKAGHWSGLCAGVVMGYICSWNLRRHS